MSTPLFIGGLGPMELGLVVLVLVLLFGASKLPKLARSMGSATGEFKKGRQEVEEELEQMRDGESAADESGAAETGAEQEPAADATSETTAEPETDVDRSNV